MIQSDVWMFGMVVYEIVARQEPHYNADRILIRKFLSVLLFSLSCFAVLVLLFMHALVVLFSPERASSTFLLSWLT